MSPISSHYRLKKGKALSRTLFPDHNQESISFQGQGSKAVEAAACNTFTQCGPPTCPRKHLHSTGRGQVQSHTKNGP
jgi:hypothetical protein